MRVLTLTLAMMFGFLGSPKAATWYVDAGATAGGKNGTSWANAWTSVGQVSGVSAGDIVYVSGGPSGQSQTYSLSSWLPAGGSASNVITYQIGQDASHNGTAIFACGGGSWVNGPMKNVVISGDAGDGKMHFQLDNVGNAVVGNGASNIRIGYVNMGSSKSAAFTFNPASKVEIDHCYFQKLDAGSGGDDHVAYAQFSDSGSFDINRWHDNTFLVPNSGNGTGDDCIQNGTDCFSFYNNRIIGVVGSYTNGQHQDGYQPLGGNYLKVYNNYFQDIANYPVFGDAYFGDFAHFWVFNNIIVITNASIRASDPPQGIAIGPDGGAFANMGRYPSFTDVVIANNLIVDYGNHGAINLRNVPGANQSSQFINCVVSNNISINSGGFGLENSSNGVVTNAANVATNMTTGAGQFVSYTQNLGNSADFHLASNDTLFRGKGVVLSSYFNFDKDGVARPSTSAWDIGPYQYNSGAPTIQPPSNLHITSSQ